MTSICLGLNVLKCRLENVGRFVSASMCLLADVEMHIPTITMMRPWMIVVIIL